MKTVAYQRRRLNWRTSSFSVNAHECVEVGQFSSFLLVRDSMDQSGPVLWLTQGQWRTLIRRVKAGVAVCEPVFA